ncbi:hypothetical protein QAD02_020156 [Eretmocerus hayati]|uniref:Uncharacterized protein n=1 Tax=Eretmocerus hayati TaxID=131215 RepID=A0ACC2PP45_9HYME|nr:hypothetical protein QAD02_020156 [Eretmocerus hayati]
MLRVGIICALLALTTQTRGDVFNFNKLRNYTDFLGLTDRNNTNELWQGIIRDCRQKVTFSCIQKNAYSYLDRTFIDHDNITVFNGFSLTRNNLDYDGCNKEEIRDNLVDDATGSSETKKSERTSDTDDSEEDENLSPLEEITHALRKKAIKFLATRDYQIQLPESIGGGSGLRVSPREIDENGALIRIDFNHREIEESRQNGRLFGKIKKQIQNKILTAVIIGILLIKILKLKFMFVVPFLFGVGTAKKLFLKLLLFFVPAFAHVFKLCSSYYSSHATKYHHHHHKIAHHHHHIPVAVPVPYSKPIYYDHPPPSHSYGPPEPPQILEEEFQGYDYAHPHIQYRKDIEELKEWGIEPYEESYDQVAPQAGVIHPGMHHPGGPKLGPKIPSAFGIPPQYAANAKPIGVFDKSRPPPGYSQSPAYPFYGPLPPAPVNKQPLQSSSLPIGVVEAPDYSPPVSQPTQPARQPSVNHIVPQQNQLGFSPQRSDTQHKASDISKTGAVQSTVGAQDDEFYGPIIQRLNIIFDQMRLSDELCRERLICSMYKEPTRWSPYSNLVSNELSRDPQELQTGGSASASSQKFYRYLNAARLGQDRGDCMKTYQCNIRTE